MKSKQHSILLVSNIWYANVARWPAMFSEVGIQVDLLASHKNILKHSKYIRNFYSAKSGYKAVIELLKTIIEDSKNAYDAVIFVDEPLIIKIFESKPEQWLLDFLPFDQSMFHAMVNKTDMVRLAQKNNITMPETLIVTDTIKNDVANASMQYPLILKENQGFGGLKVNKIESLSELNTYLDKAGSTNGRKYLLQDFIEGEIGVSELLCHEGKILACMSSLKSKTIRMFGPSTARQFVDYPDILPMAKQLAELTQFNGFCGFDWVKAQGTDKIYFLEFHYRPPSGFHLGEHCNIDFFNIYMDLLEGIINEPSVNEAFPFLVHVFPQHFATAFKQKDFKELVGWLPFLDTQNRYDRIPFSDYRLLKHLIQ